MTAISRFMSKAKYKFLRRLPHLLLLACLIAIAAVQPVLGNHANAFTRKPSTETISSNVAASSGEKVDDTLLHSTSKQNLEKPAALAQNWQTWDWDGDSKWFRQNFCNGVELFCTTNLGYASSGRQIASKLRITGMAAGFDTRARIVIQYRRCKGILPGTKCGWRTSVDEILEPRRYKTWTYSDGISRTARIDAISGDLRTHLAVVSDAQSSPGSWQSPYQSFNFCVDWRTNDGRGGVPSTKSVMANNSDEALKKLYQELGYAGAGTSWNVRPGACQ